MLAASSSRWRRCCGLALMMALMPWAIWLIDDFGAGDVIEVERPDKKRFMVPMNADAVPDWSAERLVVDTAFVV